MNIVADRYRPVIKKPHYLKVMRFSIFVYASAAMLPQVFQLFFDFDHILFEMLVGIH
jgi:hypothetical protein